MKITKTKSGKYTTHIAINGIDGGRHYKRFTAKTKKEVMELAAAYVADNTVYAESLAFGDALDRYIDRAGRSLSPSTIAAYKSNQSVLRDQYEKFCRLSCDRIRSQDIQTIIDDMRLKGKSAKTIRNRIGLISAVITAEGFKMPSYNAPQASVPRFNVPDEEIYQEDVRSMYRAIFAPFHATCARVLWTSARRNLRSDCGRP